MNCDFDCIVVGAGPAGATASYHLAKLGHSILMLEKQSLPRYKPCGGGVSPEIQKWFDFDFSPVISTKSNIFQCSWKMGKSTNGVIDDQYEPLWMVRREQFDYFIVEKAIEQGAEIEDKSKVIGLQFLEGVWHIRTVKRTYSCRYIVAADGSGGPMWKLLGFNNRKFVKFNALEVEVRSDLQADNIIHLDFGSLERGYAWNFPKADGFSFGIGGDHKKLKTMLEEYMQGKFDTDLGPHRLFGHTINCWNGNQRLDTTQALLVGESACLVDPFTAEGIRPCIYSGLVAAESIDKALTEKHTNLSSYSKKISTTIGKEMFWARLLSQFFYIAPQLAFESIVAQPSASTVMGQIINGELKYSETLGKVIKKVFLHYLKF